MLKNFKKCDNDSQNHLLCWQIPTTHLLHTAVIKHSIKGEGHMAKQCTTRKRVKDYEWFKDKMLLAQAQEAGVVLDEEQHDFLADNLEETNDYYDDEATANAIFMENLSPIGSLNDNTVAPQLGYIENIVSTNESYDGLKGNSDVISYIDYMLTIRDDADNYVPPPVQKDDMMLFVIEQMKSQVEKYTKVNQESKSEIESLTSELERYKDRVRVLGYAVKDSHSEQEAYLNRELYTVINDRNRKNFETLKQESFEKYEKNISEIVDLENAKKNLENIVFKVHNGNYAKCAASEKITTADYNCLKTFYCQEDKDELKR
ncbi:hypothetical protein Tco_0619269 [Tanacetum coccineum]